MKLGVIFDEVVKSQKEREREREREEVAEGRRIGRWGRGVGISRLCCMYVCT
jgi:hypothetical protein